MLYPGNWPVRSKWVLKKLLNILSNLKKQLAWWEKKNALKQKLKILMKTFKEEISKKLNAERNMNTISRFQRNWILKGIWIPYLVNNLQKVVLEVIEKYAFDFIYDTFYHFHCKGKFVLLRILNYVFLVIVNLFAFD